MGQVKFGSDNSEPGKFRPLIMFEVSGKELTFAANFYLQSEEDARACVTDLYMIITGPQSNVQYSKEGLI